MFNNITDRKKTARNPQEKKLEYVQKTVVANVTN